MNKLFATGVLKVNDYGYVESILVKEKDFKRSEYDTHTSGLIKYLGLPEGTKIRVTIEVLEESK